jgi:hypothetical protein
MLQLWSVSKLNDVPLAIRRKLRFYAPLIESLDFMGAERRDADLAIFTRGSTSSAIWRDGASHSIGQNVPRFEYDPSTQLALGVKLSSGEALSFPPANGLHNGDTLIWFEENTPMSTPTNANPFNSSGTWAGTLDIHIKHVAKAVSGMTLSAAEINQIQEAMHDIAQDIPLPVVTPPLTGQFFLATPESGLGGVINGANTVFTLNVQPNLNSMIAVAHGTTLKRVAAAPGYMEYVVSGPTNQTLTLGLAPAINIPFFVHGVVA